jgi:hypothetical protein
MIAVTVTNHWHGAIRQSVRLSLTLPLEWATGSESRLSGRGRRLRRPAPGRPRLTRTPFMFAPQRRMRPAAELKLRYHHYHRRVVVTMIMIIMARRFPQPAAAWPGPAAGKARIVGPAAMRKNDICSLLGF